MDGIADVIWNAKGVRDMERKAHVIWNANALAYVI